MATKRSSSAPNDYATKADLRLLDVKVSALDGEMRAMGADVRALGVVLERVDSKVTALGEGMASLRTEFKSDLAALEARLSERIAVLEDVVRQNSADIRQNSADIRQNSADILKNSEDIRTLHLEVAQLRHDFDHHKDPGRLTALEERVKALEKRARVRP